MEGEVERSPVNRQQELPAQHPVRIDRLLRREMDIGPRLTVCADLDQRQVERPMRGADVREAGEGAGVTAVEDTVPRPRDGPRCPERVIAVAEAAPREVARRCRGERE